MKPLLRWLLLASAAAILAILAVGRAAGPQFASLPEPDLPADIDLYLERAEASVPNLRAGAQKEVLWADASREKTPISIVYLHGYSASRVEISPVAERVARHLGANLFLTRLAGHGRDGPAMAEPRLSDWMADSGRGDGDRPSHRRTCGSDRHLDRRHPCLRRCGDPRLAGRPGRDRAHFSELRIAGARRMETPAPRGQMDPASDQRT